MEILVFNGTHYPCMTQIDPFGSELWSATEVFERKLVSLLFGWTSLNVSNAWYFGWKPNISAKYNLPGGAVDQHAHFEMTHLDGRYKIAEIEQTLDQLAPTKLYSCFMISSSWCSCSMIH